MCHSNDALIRESHQQMSQRLSTLEERQHEMHTSMGFETPLWLSSIHLFLLQLWKTAGCGIATPTDKTKMKMKTMMMTARLRKNQSEDPCFSFSLSGV
jgi:hypothetical protein